MDDYWLKQTTDKPLFDDLMWSKPENKMHAGKLLIIGGSSNGFAHTVGCFSESQNAGAGVVKVLIPESTRKLIGNWSEDIYYGPSTKSGGFSQLALADMIEYSNWADAVLLSGELGNNSETTILFEKYLDKYNGSLIISSDAFDFTYTFIDKLLKIKNVTYILDFNRLQKLSLASKIPKPITSKTTLVNLIEIIHEITELNEANLVIEFEDYLIVGSQGYVSTTKIESKDHLQIKLAADSAVWFMQNKSKVFEALSCAVITSQKLL